MLVMTTTFATFMRPVVRAAVYVYEYTQKTQPKQRIWKGFNKFGEDFSRIFG